MLPAMKTQSVHHWIAREVSAYAFLVMTSE